MDAFELNKIAGAVLAALLMIFASKTLMDIATKPHALEKPAYEVAVTESKGGAQQAAAAVKVAPAELMKLGSVELGKDEFKKCAICHTVDKGGKAGAQGPNLFGVLNRPVGAGTFDYSTAMKAKGGSWSYELLQCYLADPKGCIPGNKMAFPGLRDNERLASVIHYLRSLADTPAPLPQ
jgi:cytochrome c